MAEDRVDYLDWLKALIVFGIFLFHVSLVFSIVPWLVSNDRHSLILSAFAGFTFPWGIPAMFLIAGADARFGLRSHSAPEYVRSRFLRLLVPLGAGMVLLTPLQRYLTSGRFPPPPGSLVDHYVTFLRHPTWDPLHLWFLGYLFMISLATLPVMLWLRTSSGGRLIATLVQIANHRGGLFLFALPLVVSQLLLRPHFPAYQSWADFATYTIVFLFGAVLFSNRGFESAIGREISWILAGGVAAIVMIGILIYLAPGHLPNGPRVPADRQVLYAAGWSLNIWFWLLAVQYLGIRWLDFPNRAMAYARESILPFYVIHHPVVLAVSSVIVTLNLGLWPKFGLVVVFGLGFTLLIYEFAIRRWYLTRVIFGLKTKPPRLSAPAPPRMALP